MRTGRIKRLAVLTLPAVALLPAAAAQAEVYKQSETGFVIRHAADVTAPPEEAWAALLRPAGWWSKQQRAGRRRRGQQQQQGPVCSLAA